MMKFCMVLFAALCSCVGESKKTADVVRLDLTGEVVLEDVFLGAPEGIMFYDDLMLIRDEYDDKALSVVEMESGALVGRELNIGRGPGEMTNPFRLYIHGNRLYAHRMDIGRVSIYSLPGMEYMESFDMDDSPRSSLRMADYYVGEGEEATQGRLQIFDTLGRYLFAGSDFPDRADNSSTAFGAVAYQGSYCVHPNKNLYAFAALYSDKIEFHEILGGKHIMVSESGTENVRADHDATGNAILAPDVFLGIASMCAGEDLCYMLYIGKNRNEDGVRRGFSDTVLGYDWDGNQTVSYKLDRQIAGLAVDESSGHMYGLALNDEDYVVIIKYDMRRQF